MFRIKHLLSSICLQKKLEPAEMAGTHPAGDGLIWSDPAFPTLCGSRPNGDLDHL